MSELPTLYRVTPYDADQEGVDFCLARMLDTGVLVPVEGDLLSRVEAANAMMAFLDQHGGDVGQPWPTIEDALAWLGADDG